MTLMLMAVALIGAQAQQRPAVRPERPVASSAARKAQLNADARALLARSRSLRMRPGVPPAEVDDLRRIQAEVERKLDEMDAMGETESLRLQMAMDRLSQLMSTLSNMMKKSSDTAQDITQNLK